MLFSIYLISNKYIVQISFLSAAIIKILVTKEKEKHVSRGGSARDEFIKRAYQQLHDFSENKPIQEDLIPFFNNAIKRR